MNCVELAICLVQFELKLNMLQVVQDMWGAVGLPRFGYGYWSKHVSKPFNAHVELNLDKENHHLWACCTFIFFSASMVLVVEMTRFDGKSPGKNPPQWTLTTAATARRCCGHHSRWLCHPPEVENYQLETLPTTVSKRRVSWEPKKTNVPKRILGWKMSVLWISWSKSLEHANMQTFVHVPDEMQRVYSDKNWISSLTSSSHNDIPSPRQGSGPQHPAITWRFPTHVFIEFDDMSWYMIPNFNTCKIL